MAEDEGASKISGIGQLVRLKEMLQKWQSLALTPRGNSPPSDHKFPSGISPAIDKRLKDDYILCDSDEDSCHSPSLPSDVPKGYLAVYVVGEELRRFIIPTDYLSHPVFKVLLEKVEEEFGFDHQGGLTIPCEIETFKYLLKCMETHHNLSISTNDEDDLRSVE